MRVVVGGGTALLRHGLALQLAERSVHVLAEVALLRDVPATAQLDRTDAVVLVVGDEGSAEPPGPVGWASAAEALSARHPGLPVLVLGTDHGTAAPAAWTTWLHVDASLDGRAVVHALERLVARGGFEVTRGRSTTERGAPRGGARTPDGLVTALVRARGRMRARGLTAGETLVLDLLAHGYSNDGIARSLGISLKTVETHVSSVFDKLGLAGHQHGTNRRVLAALQWADVATDS